MKRFWLLGPLGLFLLCACNSATPTPLTATATKPPATATIPQEPATPFLFPSPTTGPQEIQGVTSFPLAAPGPYFAGNREYTIVDESRNGREIKVLVWYPALEGKDAYDRPVLRDVPPDMSGAPYPLILIEPNSGRLLFSSHLATHGFAMAIVQFPEEFDNWDYGVDHPRDMIFALEQIASNPPEGLEGVIDTDHVGVTGYSWGGFFSLAVSGVRIDPEYYLSYCEQAQVKEPEVSEEYLENACRLAQNWDEFASSVGDEITTSEDGLWQPVTDERIRAVMPMAADGAWLYGERGLASVDRPVLMIAATEDQLVPYPLETVYIYEHLGAPAKSLISFIGKSHMMVFDEEQANQMKHFATAFFGYHLQGREDYAEYFSEDFVSQFDDLAWGVYSEK